MREWSLESGDPLELTLAADFRLCNPDYVNDQIWELEPGGGDPPALSLRTTYGLRACMMRIFPQFTLDGQTVSDPQTFRLPPQFNHFYPNYLSMNFWPFEGINISAEYWVPDSHTIAGRLTTKNKRSEPAKLTLDLCAQLVPIAGQSLTHFLMKATNILIGRTSDLTPVIFLSGGARPGSGALPSLSLELELGAGNTRSLIWVEAALITKEESFEKTRLTAAFPWDAEIAKIDMVNAAQSIELQTGDADWDAAFALSQKTAFRLFFATSQHLPNPSFVLSRQPDQGYSPRGDGSDYASTWSGQSPLECFYLANIVPGAPELVAGLVRNFLVTQSKDGEIDWKPGMGGQCGRWLAAPLLTSLAWRSYQRTQDLDFLRDIQPGLEAFNHCWLRERHDQDGDGFPEWEHPQQAGLEEYPAFTSWLEGGQGADIAFVESPALSAFLCHEAKAQACIAEALDQLDKSRQWDKDSDRFRALTTECLDGKIDFYHLRDRDTHACTKGKRLGTWRGAGKTPINKTLKQPLRLIVRIELNGTVPRHLEIKLHGKKGGARQVEVLDRLDFHWGERLAVATTKMVYSEIIEIEASGLEKKDRISLSVMDLSTKDITLFMPLWAGIPEAEQALNIIQRNLLATDKFGRPYGIPACETSSVKPRAKRSAGYKNMGYTPFHQAVHIPWNTFIGEGLLNYQLQREAAWLITRLMTAIIQNLKERHSFWRAYNSEDGTGMGERNSLQGLAPLGLFLETLGVQIETPKRVILCGKNPFPWPVTVKYRGMTITRNEDHSTVMFADGQKVTLDDPCEIVVFTG
jgi:hypothetical protein